MAYSSLSSCPPLWPWCGSRGWQNSGTDGVNASVSHANVKQKEILLVERVMCLWKEIRLGRSPRLGLVSPAAAERGAFVLLNETREPPLLAAGGAGGRGRQPCSQSVASSSVNAAMGGNSFAQRMSVFVTEAGGPHGRGH